jgi:hypothetical protein
MKKGLILALLMVVVLCLALPAGAVAPLIKEIPNVVIGDTEDVASGMTVSRYINAFNLGDASVVDWKNLAADGYTTDLFHAYFWQAVTTGTDITTVVFAKPGTYGLIDALSVSEKDALIAGGAVPAAGTRITTATSMWASFLDSGLDTAITNVYNPDVAGDGHATGNTYKKTAILTLICGVDNGSSLTLDSGSVDTFTVTSENGVPDGATTVVIVEDIDGADLPTYWTYGTLVGFTPLLADTDVNGMGFARRAGTVGASEFFYASWETSYRFDGSETVTDDVYRLVVTAISDATTGDLCPGYRLLATDLGVAHFVQMEMRTDGFRQDGTTRNDQFPTEANAPFGGGSGTTKEIKMYWAVPHSLAQMGDSGELNGLSDWVTAATMLPPGDSIMDDGRDYKLTFAGAGVPGDWGTLIATNIQVALVPRPDVVTPSVAWGTPVGTANTRGTPASQLNFNTASASGGWQQEPAFSGFNGGTATLATGSVTITIGNAPTTGDEGYNRYCGVVVDDVSAPTTANIRPLSNRLYRFAAELSCSDALICPRYRIGFSSVFWGGTGAGSGNKQIRWIEEFAASSVLKICKVPGLRTIMGQTETPAAPVESTTAPSLVEIYAYVHDVATQNFSTADSRMKVGFNCFDTGQFVGGAASDWPDNTGTITMHYASWELLPE